MDKEKSPKTISIDDCERLYELGYNAIVNDGRLDGFIKDPEGKPQEHIKIIWLNAAN